MNHHPHHQRIYYSSDESSRVCFSSGAVEEKEEESCLLPKHVSKRSALFHLSVCSLIISGGLINFGFNNVVTNSSYHVISKEFHGTPNFRFLWSLAVSIFAIGGMFGAFLGPHIARSIGRKKTLILNNVLVIAGGVMLFFVKMSRSITLLCFGRIIVGFNAGVNTVVAPMYLAEIAPVHVRGSLGTLSQFGIVSGLLLGNILGLKGILGNARGWPFLFGTTAVIGFIQLALLPFCPESPRWLIACKKDDASAFAALRRLRASEDVVAEVEDIKLDAARESQLQQVGVLELFKNSYYHKPILISVVLQLAQQLSGIGGILFYSTSFFVDLGVNETNSQLATCGVGGLSVIMTVVVIFLVERAGRRVLMLFGLGAMSILYIVVTIALKYDAHQWGKVLGVVATLGSVAVFQSGPGAIPWFIVSELFSQTSISAAVSVAGPCNWLSNFLVGLVFQDINRGLHPYTFIPFAVLLFLFFLFTWFVVPETKGRTIAEINNELHGGRNEEVIANPHASTNSSKM